VDEPHHAPRMREQRGGVKPRHRLRQRGSRSGPIVKNPPASPGGLASWRSASHRSGELLQVGLGDRSFPPPPLSLHESR
jgi:hypothetical protein